MTPLCDNNMILNWKRFDKKQKIDEWILRSISESRGNEGPGEGVGSKILFSKTIII